MGPEKVRYNIHKINPYKKITNVDDVHPQLIVIYLYTYAHYMLGKGIILGCVIRMLINIVSFLLIF